MPTTEEVTARFVALMQAFQLNKMDSAAFEHAYLRLFDETRDVSWEAAFEPLNDVFAAVDAYCADPALRDGESRSGEEELKDAVHTALASLHRCGLA